MMKPIISQSGTPASKTYAARSSAAIIQGLAQSDIEHLRRLVDDQTKIIRQQTAEIERLRRVVEAADRVDDIVCHLNSQGEYDALDDLRQALNEARDGGVLEPPT